MSMEDKKEAERLRKADYRAKQTLIKNGTYVASPIEQAKKLLETMLDPDVAAAYNDKEIGGQLKAEDKKALYNFIHHLKIRRRKEQEDEARRLEQERLISEKGQMFVNQKTYDLHQALLMAIDEAEKVTIIKSTIDTNLFLFLEYMESYQLPFTDFLKIVIGLQDQLDIQSFTELFVRVCRYQKIEDLSVSREMVGNALTFLVEKKKDDKAAYGLLWLIYQSHVTLSGFEKTVLIKFQEEYHQSILRFFKSISNLESQVAESLPASAFCFTSPILRVMRDGGKAFFTQIPYQFMPYLIQIICYSFTQNDTSFHNFLEIFKEGMKEHFNTLIENKFTDLLQKLLEETMLMRPQFFGSLDQQSTLLKKAFSLLKERQIFKFSQKVIFDLIGGDDESYRLLVNGPRIVSQNHQVKLKPLLKELRTLNSSLNIGQYELDRDMDLAGKNYFRALGIQAPLQLQSVCYNFCTSDSMEGRWLVQLDTGSGKTALCFAVACFYARKGFKVLILNVSEELTFRDYKKALPTAKETEILVNFMEKVEEETLIQDGITFISFKAVSQLLVINKRNKIDEFVVISDEFDQILFGDSDFIQLAIELFPLMTTFIGFSGSDLKQYHIHALEQTIRGRTMKLNITDIFKPTPVNQGVDVYTRISDYRQIIESMSAQQVLKTPVIVIADDKNLQLTKKLKNSGIPVEALFQSTFTESNGSLTIFTKKQGGKYPVFIINDAQGRGLDFPSGSEIEEEGGVFLIIGKLPSSFLQYKQFLGRTGRMGNKSQYCVVLHDTQAQNEEGQTYLDKKLEVLQNQDLQRASQISQAVNQIIKGPPDEQDHQMMDIHASIEHLHEEVKNDGLSMSIPIEIDQTISEQQSKENLNQALENDENKKDPGIRKRDAKAQRKKTEQDDLSMLQQAKQNQLVDQGYFEGYSRKNIHHEMCSDQRRIQAFETALKAVCSHKSVIDVGAGTGVLSFMACEAGADKVIGIEQAEIFSKFKREVNQRQLKGSIKIMNCKAEEAPLDGISVDIIVSEWMGYFLLCERMLPSVLNVRDKCLSQGGIMVPCNAKIIIAAANLPHIEKVLIHGNEGDAIKLDGQIQTVPDDHIVSSHAQILELCLQTIRQDFDSFTSEFKVTLLKSAAINAFIGWFEVEMTKGVWFSTSPFEPPTHWQQVVFPILAGEVLPEGAEVSGSVTCKPIRTNYRGLDLTFNFANLGQGQTLSFNYLVQ